MTDNSSAFLPTTTYAVLGLLSLGQELSGYEIRQWALRSLKFFYWSPAQSHIYRELRRLEELGYATSSTVRQDGRPDKRVFQITDTGRAELSRWVDEAPIAPPVIKYDSALKLFFGHAASPGRLEQVLDEHRAAVEQNLEQLDAVRAMLAAGGPPEQSEQDRARWALADAVATWGQALWASDLNAVKRLRRHLQASIRPGSD